MDWRRILALSGSTLILGVAREAVRGGAALTYGSTFRFRSSTSFWIRSA